MSRSRYARGLNPRPGDLVTHRDGSLRLRGESGLGLIIQVIPGSCGEPSRVGVFWMVQPCDGRYRSGVGRSPFQVIYVTYLECLQSTRTEGTGA